MEGNRVSTIVYLAAIASIPKQLYESATIEGANRLQKTIYLTIPSILYIVTILFILRVGSIINENFEQIFNLYNPAVYEVADVFETFVYRRGLVDGEFSYASAVGLFKSVSSLVLVAATNMAVKRQDRRIMVMRKKKSFGERALIRLIRCSCCFFAP